MRQGRGKGSRKETWAVLSILLVVILTRGKGWIQMLPTFGGETRSIEKTVAEGEMKVTFLDVGQGDCTIIQTKDRAMMIDAGNNDQGEKVVDTLYRLGVEKLDYLILTHPDADHIGGADHVLRQIPTEQVVMPDVVNDTMTYYEVEELIREKEIPVTHPEVGKTYLLQDAAFTILCPERTEEEDLNASSVGVKLVHGDVSFVMCGDADTESEERMVKTFGEALQCDVLKCGHHGSSTSTSDAFLKKTDPAWAVISCGADNPYGHPHWEVLEKLEREDIQIYRTDQLGTLTAVSDGRNIHWETAR